MIQLADSQKRRLLIAATVVIAVWLWQPTLTHAIETQSADVVVHSANPAGISAAVAAARSGASVVLLDKHAHVGGIISGGLSNIDNFHTGAVGGLFNEFKQRIVEHYKNAFGKDSEQVKDCKGVTDARE
jgi:flavin-dependent dehydrogenase